MKLNFASAVTNGFFMLVHAARVAWWILALLLTLVICYQVVQNMAEHQEWHRYARDNNCYVSFHGETSKAFDEHGGRLATNPAPKVWSCDNGLNFTRY